MMKRFFITSAGTRENCESLHVIQTWTRSHSQEHWFFIEPKHTHLFLQMTSSCGLMHSSLIGTFDGEMTKLKSELFLLVSWSSHHWYSDVFIVLTVCWRSRKNKFILLLQLHYRESVQTCFSSSDHIFLSESEESLWCVRGLKMDDAVFVLYFLLDELGCCTRSCCVHCLSQMSNTALFAFKIRCT